MAKNRITIRLVGSERDGGDVRLSEFIAQLEAFSEVLKQTERALSGRTSNFIYYKVVDLTHSSPATVVLEPVARNASPVTPHAVTHNFLAGVRAIRRKKAPQGADLAMMESYRALSNVSLKHNIQRVEIVETTKKVIPIDSVFSEKVDEIIGPDIYSFGTLSGRLESINLHNTLKFVIYPVVGPQKITCEFKSQLRAKVKAALDNYVTISGRLRYKQMDKYPYAIDAKDIDLHELHSDLPTLHDLRGISSNSTEGMSAEEFVRSIRNANW
jgi:hypothetical protein